RASAEPLPPQPPGCVAKARDGKRVPADAVVLKVSAQLGAKQLALHGDREDAHRAQPLVEGLQRASESGLRSPSHRRPPAFAGGAPVVGKAQEIEVPR